jgi:hypothetical protein
LARANRSQSDINTLSNSAPVVGTINVKSIALSEGLLVSTLSKTVQKPSLLFKLPDEIKFEIARDYQRDDEKPGTFFTDV